MFEFLGSLFAFLFDSKSSEAIKKRALKTISKRIKSSRFSKFYKRKTKEVTPACGQFFFEIYKIVAPVQTNLEIAVKSASLKVLIVENYVDRQILESLDKYSPEMVDEESKTRPPKELAKELRDEFTAFSDSIDRATSLQIDSCYNLMLALYQFVSYDFDPLFKKFNVVFHERTGKVPKFITVKGESVSELLKDFLYVTMGLDPAQDWKTVLKLLKEFRSNEPMIALEDWYKILSRIQEILRSEIIELMIRHIDSNPDWTIKIQIPNEKIYASWLDAQKSKVETMIERIINTRMNAKIAVLAQEIFGASTTEPLQYYNAHAGQLFLSKGFEGFTQTQSLSYLSAFFQIVFDRDIQELCNLLIVRAQWRRPQFLPISEQFDAIAVFAGRINEFDETLNSDGKNGFRLANAMLKSDRDKSAGKLAKELLAKVNQEATGILIQAMESLIMINNSIDAVKTDYFQDPHELVLNWREIEVASHRPMKQWLTEISLKLTNIIKLCQLYIEEKSNVL
ncbi:MAG: DUF5312 family protein [Treponema sp.]|jgi:hypothetical protein|nr:DUF5312 family protein [Treponema sp.]